MQQQHHTSPDAAIHDVEILTQEEYQERQAEQLMQGVFGGEENAEKTGNLITHFVTSYEQHKHDMPLDQWLIREFHQYPTIWADVAELEATAREIIRTVENNNAAKVSLYQYLEKGKSRESWLAKRIEESAKAAGIVNVGEYAEQIYAALRQTNQDVAESLLDKGDTLKQLLDPDGKHKLLIDWNDASRIEFAKNIDKESLRNATLNAAKQGTRIVGRRVWNWLIGKKNPSVSEDLREFFESSLESSEHIGSQVAVSGAVVVAVKQGLINSVLKNTPIGRVVDMVTTGMEKTKILYKLAKGELTTAEALDALTNNTLSTTIATIGSSKGTIIGASIGSVFGPVGAAVGGLVGGVVGGMAGSNIAKAIYTGSEVIVKTAVSTVKSWVNTGIDTVKNAGRALLNLFS